MDTCKDWAAKIKRRKHIGDFSNWRNEGNYRIALERLLMDSKTVGGEAKVQRRIAAYLDGLSPIGNPRSEQVNEWPVPYRESAK